jgi:Holliday junction resolvasome RuvABC ATP-dependent DNA helicase subunit
VSKAAGAQADGEPCPHQLFVGPSGMGKTTLATALAKECKTTLHEVFGKAEPRTLCEVAVQIKAGDLVLFDEAHAQSAEVQLMIIEMIDHRRIPDHLKAGPLSDAAERDKDTGKLIVQPCCVVLATNQPTGIDDALKKRVEPPVYLDDYGERELVEIAESEASGRGMHLTGQALRLVARSAQGRPRRVRDLLRGLRRHCYEAVRNKQKLGNTEVCRYLASAGMDRQGLDAAQQKYLRKLYRRGRASLNTMAGLLGFDSVHVRDEVEPGLLKLDFLNILNHGRILTDAGKAWARNDRARRQERKQRRQEKKGVDRDDD